MVKKPTQGNGTARMRFILLEAEMPEGDLTQITNAIQNALRPASVSGSRLAKASVQMIGQGDRDYEDEEVIDESAGVDGEDTSEPTSKSATSKPRRPVRRKVVEIELDNDTSLSSYVGQFPPKTELEKYLVAVAFLCEHRKEVEGVSANHVYTCFLKLKWPTGSKDFSQPLRNLKSDNLLDSGKTRGTFVVNHIGRDRVLKLAEA